MRKFWIKIIIMAALVISSIFIIFFAIFILPINKSVYEAAHIDKRNFLISRIPPRIILVGGSNLAFSIDSKIIEQKTDYSVINLGLDANLGLRFILGDAKKLMKKGDIIIVSLEYDHFGLTSLDGDGLTLVHLIAVDPEALFSLTSLRQFQNIFSHLLGLINIEIKDTFFAWGKGRNMKQRDQCYDPIYCRYSFNEYGDVIIHLTMKLPDLVTKGPPFPAQPSAESVALIKDFSEFANKQNVKVFYSFPSLAKTRFDQNEKSIVAISNALQKISDLVILDFPETFAYPDDLFFDTAYHLNAKGREKRTNRLISELNKVIPPLLEKR